MTNHAAHGKPLHFISQIQDATRSKETEDALRASENEYRATFEMAGVGKAQVDLATGAFVRVNRKLCEMLGYGPEELKTLTIGQITHPGDIAANRDAASKLFSGEQTESSADTRYIRRDGRVIWVTLNATVITDAQGRPHKAVSTFQDITERKLAEQLEQARRQILEMVANDMPLPEVLGQLAAAVESQIHGCLTGVFVVQDGDVLLHGPTLSAKWRKTLLAHSLKLAAGRAAQTWASADGCGVTFVNQDKVWQDLRPVAAKHNIRACWTTPISGNE